MMAKPSLLKEAILTLKAIKKLNLVNFNEKSGDPHMYRVGRRINAVLNKAAKKAA
jgi:hypothetical protein